MVTLEEEIEKIIYSIGKNYQPERIILFGSSATGNFGEGSDIDIAVIKSTDVDPWHRTEQVDRLLAHNLPVDILVYTPEEIEERLKMNDPFVKEIVEKGKVVYEG